MSAHEGACVPYPTKPDTCLKCGHGITEPQPDAEPVGRDAAFEVRFFDDVMELADRMGQTHPSFVRAVRERLAIGADRYGDRAFMGRDNLPEVCEETPDIPAYIVLDLQKLRADHGEDSEEFQSARINLLGAAAHAALSDAFVQRERRRRAGLD